MDEGFGSLWAATAWTTRSCASTWAQGTGRDHRPPFAIIAGESSVAVGDDGVWMLSRARSPTSCASTRRPTRWRTPSRHPAAPPPCGPVTAPCGSPEPAPGSCSGSTRDGSRAGSDRRRPPEQLPRLRGGRGLDPGHGDRRSRPRRPRDQLRGGDHPHRWPCRPRRHRRGRRLRLGPDLRRPHRPDRPRHRHRGGPLRAAPTSSGGVDADDQAVWVSDYLDQTSGACPWTDWERVAKT